MFSDCYRRIALFLNSVKTCLQEDKAINTIYSFAREFHRKFAGHIVKEI